MSRVQVELDWMRRAACKDADPDLFFRPVYKWGTTPRDTGRVTQALEFCKVCEVRAECLDYAHDNNIRMGVWGGRSFD